MKRTRITFLLGLLVLALALALPAIAPAGWTWDGSDATQPTPDGWTWDDASSAQSSG